MPSVSQGAEAFEKSPPVAVWEMLKKGAFSVEWLSRSSQKLNRELSQQDVESQSCSSNSTRGGQHITSRTAIRESGKLCENANPQTNCTKLMVNSTHDRDLEEAQQRSYETILAEALGEAKNSNDMEEALPASKDWTDRRRPRTIFSVQQLSILETSFQHQPYPGTCQRQRLAGALSLSETQVKTWFQNRRMKLKQQLQDAQAEALKSRMFHQYLSCQSHSNFSFYPLSDSKYFPHHTVFGSPLALTSFSDYFALHLGNPFSNHYQNPIEIKTAPRRFHP
ncbi:homeobox expressed in ES cells 1 [Callorhinchus milii]|uniref:Homeobox expressed in ES cells 1-like n=2 Tax=Callorhinchus milii TaxID=7868 RepID=A0A4W3KC38_CALMI|nr:homeobox expressed in ES cells 1 [Callorhinchus milii]|eukprot:gi/632936344/ref/XP_007894554.1/ PREDICTED: homeobox expressed in ES cells 1-like [Callorhinchus milii]